MPEEEIGYSQFIHAKGVLKVGLTPDRVVGNRERWEKAMEGTASLGGNEVVLTRAYFEQRKPFSPGEQERIKVGKEWLERKEELGLQFTTVEGQERKLVLQALSREGGLGVDVYLLSLVALEKSREIGVDPQETELWTAVVGKDTFVKLDVGVENGRKAALAKEMVRAITGGTADAFEGLTQIVKDIGSKEGLLSEIKPFEKAGLAIELDLEGKLVISPDVEISQDAREMVEKSMDGAVRRLRKAGEVLEKPEVHVYEVFRAFLDREGYDDLIKMPRQKGEKEAKSAARERVERRDEVVTTVVEEKKAKEDRNWRLVKAATQRLVRNTGLKTGARVLELSFPETVGKGK